MPMFAMMLTYTKPMEQVSAVVGPHREYLDRFVASGNLLVSGRRNPPTGGVIIAKFPSLDAARAFAAADPFVLAGVASYEFAEFGAVKFNPAIATFVAE